MTLHKYLGYRRRRGSWRDIHAGNPPGSSLVDAYLLLAHRSAGVPCQPKPVGRKHPDPPDPVAHTTYREAPVSPLHMTYNPVLAEVSSTCHVIRQAAPVCSGVLSWVQVNRTFCACEMSSRHQDSLPVGGRPPPDPDWSNALVGSLALRHPSIPVQGAACPDVPPRPRVERPSFHWGRLGSSLRRR